MIDSWVEQIVQLKSMGHRVVIVSSGAVAEGIKRLGWKKDQEHSISCRLPLLLDRLV